MDNPQLHWGSNCSIWLLTDSSLLEIRSETLAQPLFLRTQFLAIDPLIVRTLPPVIDSIARMFYTLRLTSMESPSPIQFVAYDLQTFTLHLASDINVTLWDIEIPNLYPNVTVNTVPRHVPPPLYVCADRITSHACTNDPRFAYWLLPGSSASLEHAYHTLLMKVDLTTLLTVDALWLPLVVVDAVLFDTTPEAYVGGYVWQASGPVNVLMRIDLTTMSMNGGGGSSSINTMSSSSSSGVSLSIGALVGILLGTCLFNAVLAYALLRRKHQLGLSHGTHDEHDHGVPFRPLQD